MEDEQLASRGQIVDADLLHREPDLPPYAAWMLGDVEAGDRRGSAGGPDERAEHAHRRRLAGAVRAEDPEHLAGPDTERDPAHRLRAIRIALGEPVNDDRVTAVGHPLAVRGAQQLLELEVGRRM